MRRLCAVALALTAALGLATASPAAARTAPTCTTSRAVFANPFHNRAPHSDTSHDAYASLEAYQRGTWVGFAYDGLGDYLPLAWRPGSKPRPLEERRYRNTTWSLYRNFTVSMVGVTPSGAVVGDVQALHGRRHWAFAYLHGRRYQLRVERSWHDVRVLTVTPTGRIIGYGFTGSAARPGYRVVSWANVDATPRLLVRLNPGASRPAADQAGDVVWSAPQADVSRPAHLLVRLPSGQLRTLVSPSVEAQAATLWVAAGDHLFTEVNRHVVRWDTGSTAGSGPLSGRVVTPYSPDSTVEAAGGSGTIVYGGTSLPVRVALPSRLPVVVHGEYPATGEAVGPYNHVAFTSGKDRLVHILACR